MLGEFSKDKFPGEFMDSWRSALKSGGFEKVGTFISFWCYLRRISLHAEKSDTFQNKRSERKKSDTPFSTNDQNNTLYLKGSLLSGQ